MPKVLPFYSMTYVDFLSNKQPLKIRGITYYLEENIKNPINWQNIIFFP
jgi:hypothetical protein